MAASYPTSASSDATLGVAVNNKSTTTTDNPLLSGATTINVVDTLGFPDEGWASIVSKTPATNPNIEVFHYTGRTDTSFTGCTRGQDGTPAVAFEFDSSVLIHVIALHHNYLKDEIIALETELIAHGLNAILFTFPSTLGAVGNVLALDASDDLQWAQNGQALAVDVERQGFLNQSETTIGFDDTTFTFTLADAGSGWSYYSSGIKYTISGDKTVVIDSPNNPPTAGLYFISIDATDGSLSSSTTPWTLLDSKVPVASVTWNNANTPKYFLAEERHACLIDKRMHWYEHFLEGTKPVAVGALTGPTIGSDVDADKTFGVADSTIADEDLIQALASLAQPDGATNSYTVVYRTAATTWTWVVTNVPFRYSGTYIYWDSAGTQTVASANRYVNSYLCLGNIQGDQRFFIIQGQNEYGTLAGAQAENPGSFNFSGFPVQEYVVVYQFTWQTSAANSSSGKCTLGATPRRVTAAAIAVSASAPSIDHNSLAGLQGGAVGDYYHLTLAQQTIATQAATAALSGFVSATTQTFGGVKTFANNVVLADTAALAFASFSANTGWFYGGSGSMTYKIADAIYHRIGTTAQFSTGTQLYGTTYLGQNGIAGLAYIYPTGSDLGTLSFSATPNAGNTDTRITNAEQAGARTYTIPDAGTNADFVMTASAQAIAGIKTFNDHSIWAAGKYIRLTGGTTGTIDIVAPASVTSYTLTLPADNGDAGDVLQTDGDGTTSWVAQGSGANTALSNLASVAINTDVDPGTTNTIDLGDSTHEYKNVYLRNVFINQSATSGGFFYLYPNTASQGRLQLLATANPAGDFTTVITNSAQADNRTYNIPDAGANTFFVMGDGDISIAGLKVFTENLKVNAVSGTPLSFAVLNEASTEGAGSIIEILNESSSGAGADSSLVVGKLGGQEYSLGFDDSDSDSFKISVGDTLGTGDVIKISTGGVLTLVNGLTSGGTVVSDTNNTDDLGTSSIAWKDGYIGNILHMNSPSSGLTYLLFEKAGADKSFIGNAGAARDINIGTDGEALTQSVADELCIRVENKPLSISTNAGLRKAFNITEAGQVTQPLQPCFNVYNSAALDNVTGDNTAYIIAFNTEIFDEGSNYNTGTYTFTAPVTGIYLLTFNVTLNNVDSDVHTTIRNTIVTSNNTYSIQSDPRGLAWATPSDAASTYSILVDMDANDTAYVQLTVFGSSKSVDITQNKYSTFSGSLIN